MQRRDFLKLSATAGAVSCVTACGGKSGESVKPPVTPPKTRTYGRGGCLPNCGMMAPFKSIIEDGRMIAVEPIDHKAGESEEMRSLPCARGRSHVQKTYHPDRILYPMKRVGPRGEGQFKRISWEQALSEIGPKLLDTYDKYGPRSVYMAYSSTARGGVNNKGALQKVLKAHGGYLGCVGGYSNYASLVMNTHMFGVDDTGILPVWPKSTIAEAKYSDLIVKFGYNPAETSMCGHGQAYHLNNIQKRVPSILFDPRHNDSAVVGQQGEHVFIRPGTDGAFAEAMAYTLIVEDNEAQIDKTFLKEKCFGYWEEPAIPNPYAPGTMLPPVTKEESYKGHILGLKDGNPKTPEWAAPICGIPADKIREYARRIASATTPFIVSGYSVQRQANGEDNIRAIMTFTAIIGAMGRRGTNTGDFPNSNKNWGANALQWLKSDPDAASLNFMSWLKAIDNAKEVSVLGDGLIIPDKEKDEFGNGYLKQNIKAMFQFGGNTLNQHHNSMKARKLLVDDSLIELVVTIENHMTPTAEISDYILPESGWFEKKDWITDGPGGYAAQLVMRYGTDGCIKPLGEAKPMWEICRLLAKETGVEQEFTEGRTYDEELQHTYTKYLKVHDSNLPDSFDEFLKGGVYKTYIECDDSDAGADEHCALYHYRNTPGAKLKTVSGKIDIYSHTIAMQGMAIDAAGMRPDNWPDPNGYYVNAIARHMVAPESYQDDSENLKDFPLQLINFHGKGQAHSTFWNVSWLRESNEDAVWVNAVDAPAGVKNGDLVIIESRRGKSRMPIKITPRMMPGVIAQANGIWFKQNEQGIDIGGCPNTHTQDEVYTPYAKANPTYTNRVRIYKA